MAETLMVHRTASLRFTAWQTRYAFGRRSPTMPVTAEGWVIGAQSRVMEKDIE